MAIKYAFLFLTFSNWTIYCDCFSSRLVPPSKHGRLLLHAGNGGVWQSNILNDRQRSKLYVSFTTTEEENELITTTLFDFTGREKENAKTIESFQRIDDAIMGGISTSTLRSVIGKPYASFSGVCREDGG